MKLNKQTEKSIVDRNMSISIEAIHEQQRNIESILSRSYKPFFCWKIKKILIGVKTCCLNTFCRIGRSANL